MPVNMMVMTINQMVQYEHLEYIYSLSEEITETELHASQLYQMI